MGPPRYGHPESEREQRLPRTREIIEYLTGAVGKYRCIYNKFYGQAERAISNGQLSMLPHLHIRPIEQVVFLCSYYLSVGRSHLGEGFTLICIQRLS